jgi:ribosome-associated translation inhibitor RaiA
MNNLPSFDIEYMFSRIRAKSIGEKLDLIISCRNCENKVDFKINLDDVQIQTDKEHQAKFMLNDSLGVEMKYPKFKINLNDLFQSGVEPFFQEIENCIKAIYTVEGKYIEIGPEDKEEVSEFVASMNTEQFAKIEKFFETMPKLSHVTDVLCDKCGAVNKARVEGLANFFV